MNTIIEKIRAEVERRRDLYYKYCVKQGFGTYTEARYREDVDLLSFLDTLKEQPVDWQKVAEAHAKDQPLGQDNDGNLVYLQEQPVCEGLEEEAEHFCEDMWDDLPPLDIPEGKKVISVVHKCARHFAQWGAEHLADESKTKYAFEKVRALAHEVRTAYERGIEVGRKEQKEKMMKEAIDVTLNYTHQITLEGGEGFGKKGEHIKLFIIKED